MTGSKQQALLIIAAVLALLQFVVVPKIEYQNDVLEQLRQVNQQLGRVQAMVASDTELQQRLTELPVLQQQLAERYLQQHPDQSLGQVRLNLQQQLQQQLAAYQLQVTVFDWVGQRSEPGLGLELNQARVLINGQPEQLMQAYMSLFNGQNGWSVESAEFRAVDSGGGNQNNATLTLLVQTVVLQSSIVEPDRQQGVN